MNKKIVSLLLLCIMICTFMPVITMAEADTVYVCQNPGRKSYGVFTDESCGTSVSIDKTKWEVKYNVYESEYYPEIFIYGEIDENIKVVFPATQSDECCILGIISSGTNVLCKSIDAGNKGNILFVRKNQTESLTINGDIKGKNINFTNCKGLDVTVNGSLLASEKIYIGTKEGNNAKGIKLTVNNGSIKSDYTGNVSSNTNNKVGAVNIIESTVTVNGNSQTGISGHIVNIQKSVVDINNVETGIKLYAFATGSDFNSTLSIKENSKVNIKADKYGILGTVGAYYYNNIIISDIESRLMAKAGVSSLHSAAIISYPKENYFVREKLGNLIEDKVNADYSTDTYYKGTDKVVTNLIADKGLATALDITKLSSDTDSYIYGYSWDNDTKTLTLKGLYLNITSNTTGIALKLPSGTNLNILDNSLNIIHYNSEETCHKNAIVCEGNLSITGSGKVYINSTKDLFSAIKINGQLDYSDSYFYVKSKGTAIEVFNDVNVNSGMLKVSLTKNDEGQYAIESKNGNININGGNVLTKGGSEGIIAESGTLNITDGTVKTNARITGLWAKKLINISGGVICATATNVSGLGNTSKAIYCNSGDIIISNDSNVSATGISSEDNENSFGIRAKGNVIIKDSATVKAIGNTFGIQARNTSTENKYNIDISGTPNVTAFGNTKAFDASGNINIDSSLEIKAGDVENKAQKVWAYDNEKYANIKYVPVIEDSKPVVATKERIDLYGIPTIYIGENKQEIKVLTLTDTYQNEENAFSAEAPIIIVDNRTFLGIRDMATVLGVAPEAIKWDDDTKTATITKSGATISVTQGSKDIKLTYKGYIYTIENDVSAINKNDRIYLPFRVIFELFGYEVNWDNETRTITCK